MAPARKTPRLTLADFKPETLRGVAGFVRIGQTHRGQWWLLDADNRPFFSCGVTQVRPAARPGQGSTADLAAPAEPLIEAAETPDFATATLRRLRAWHVNTLGAGAAPELLERGMHYTASVDFARQVPAATIKLGGALLPDVFDPGWLEACDQAAAESCGLQRNREHLIGYFTDYELGWAQPHAEALFAQVNLAPKNTPRLERPSLLQICLSLEPAFSAYHAAWEFTLAPHAGDLAALARAWEIPLPNKEALRQLTLADTPLLSAGYLADNDRFSREFARSYFTTCAAAIRRYDPHHLILGCAFGGPPGAAVLAECSYPHVDVLSANDYHDTLFERIETYAQAASMPVLLGEFSWVSDYFTKRPQAGEPRGWTTLERMLGKGRAALERAFTHPALVGYAWHRWRDQSGDAAPLGHGLVHVDDREAIEHTELLSDLNSHAERLRRATSP